MSAQTRISGGLRVQKAGNAAKSAPERPREPQIGPSEPRFAKILAEYRQIDRDPDREALAAADLAQNDPLVLADDREIAVRVLLECRTAELGALPGLVDGLSLPDEDKARLRHPARHFDG